MSEVPFVGDGSSRVPPFLSQIRSGMENLRESMMQPVLEGMTDEIRRVFEQEGLLASQRDVDWSRAPQEREEITQAATEDARDRVRRQFDFEQRSEHVQRLGDLDLPEDLKESAIYFLDRLGLYGEEVRQQAALNRIAGDTSDEVMRTQMDTILAAMGIDEDVIEKAKRLKDIREAGPLREPDAYDDVIETGRLDPQATLDSEGFPEARADGSGQVKRANEDEVADEARQDRAERKEQAKAARADDPYTDPMEGASSRLVGPPTDFRESMRRYSSPGAWREDVTGVASNRVNRWASEWSSGNRPERVQAEDGSWAWDDEVAGARYENRMGTVGRINQALDTYGQGGGVAGAIGRAAPALARTAGVAGAAVGGAVLARSAMDSQRQANMPYTSTYGRGQLDAYGQRADEWVFSNLETYGGMSSQDASRLYQGVAQQGLEGSDREQGLGFGSDAYRRFGMDVSTSMQFIEMATEQGVGSLREYETALVALAEVAKESGVSIKETHQAYMEALRDAQNLTSGTAASEQAEAVTAIETRLRNTPLEGVNLGALLTSETALAHAAQDMDLDYGELEDALASGDQQAVAGVFSSGIGQILETLPTDRISEGTKASIGDIEQSNGGSWSSDQIEDVARMLRADGVWTDDRDLRSVTDAFMPGAFRTPAERRQAVVRAIVDDDLLDFSGAIESYEEQRADASLDMSGLDVSRVESDARGFFAPSWLPGVGQQTSRDSRNQMMAEWGLRRGGLQGRIPFREFTVPTGANNVYAGAEGYFDALQEGDLPERSVGVESIMEHIGGLAEEDPDAARAWNERVFKTQVEGEDVEFNIRDAAKYAEQFDAGQVRFVDASGREVHAHDYLGITPPGLREERAEQRVNVQVEVEAKGALADVLTVNSLGGPAAEHARSTGQPMEPDSPEAFGSYLWNRP